MKKEFTPFLKDVIPSLFAMATLNPEMSVGNKQVTGDIADVLNEVNPHKPGEDRSKFTINTDEIEEKDVAIQMLTVFIDELGGGFAQYVDQAS